MIALETARKIVPRSGHHRVFAEDILDQGLHACALVIHRRSAFTAHRQEMACVEGIRMTSIYY